MTTNSNHPFDFVMQRGVDDLLEDDFATLAVLHKHAMKQAQDYDARNNLELGSNQSTMFISRPASPRGRGYVTYVASLFYKLLKKYLKF